MKKIFLIIKLLSIQCCFCQNAFKLPVIGDKNFSSFIEESFQKKFDSKLDTLGISGLCWVKFKIDSNRYLQKIKFSPGTHPNLSDCIKEILKETNGYWEYRNAHEWIIIPFRYILQINGKTEEVKIDPYELEEFFSEKNNSEIQQYNFLSTQEFVSPFDRNINRKMKIAINNK